MPVIVKRIVQIQFTQLYQTKGSRVIPCDGVKQLPRFALHHPTPQTRRVLADHEGRFPQLLVSRSITPLSLRELDARKRPE
jgi:hypothetical protein